MQNKMQFLLTQILERQFKIKSQCFDTKNILKLTLQLERSLLSRIIIYLSPLGVSSGGEKLLYCSLETERGKWPVSPDPPQLMSGYHTQHKDMYLPLELSQMLGVSAISLFPNSKVNRWKNSIWFFINFYLYDTINRIHSVNGNDSLCLSCTWTVDFPPYL